MEHGGSHDRSSDAGPLGDLARELRVGIGDAFRAEAEEGERLAARAVLRRRSLADVAVALGDEGGTLTVQCGHRRFTGTVRHASEDLLTLDASGGPVHVNLALPVVVHLDSGPGAASARVDDDTPSFKARLFELELENVDLELGLACEPAELAGRLCAVALDHVLVETSEGDRWAVALDALRYVRRRGSPRVR